MVLSITEDSCFAHPDLITPLCPLMDPEDPRLSSGYEVLVKRTAPFLPRRMSSTVCLVHFYNANGAIGVNGDYVVNSLILVVIYVENKGLHYSL